jgi:hypothetical protein
MILSDRIVGVRGVVDEQCQHADAPEHHGWEYDQHDAGHSATLTGHSSHARRRALPVPPAKIARLLAGAPLSDPTEHSGRYTASSDADSQIRAPPSREEPVSGNWTA